MPNDNPPVVQIQPSVVGLDEFVRLDTLFTVTDPDDDSEVLRIQFRDNFDGKGYFAQNGVSLQANQWHEVTAAQLGSISYRGASEFARESISVRVFDGIYWSNAAFGSITSGNRKPELEVMTSRVPANSSTRINQTFSYFDADGDPAVRYLFVDRKIDGAQFKLGESLMPEGQWFPVLASNLPNLFYQASGNQGSEEGIGVMVYDGYSWSDMEEFQMITSSETIITGTDASVLVNEMIPATDLFTTYDEDGDEAVLGYFNDYRINADGGYWQYQGQRMPSASWFSVPAENFDQLFYVGGSTGPQVERVGIQIYDGFEFSDVVQIEVRTVTPPEVSGRDVEVQAGHFLNIDTGGTANVSGTVPGGFPVLDYLDADGDDIEEFMFVERQFNANGGGFVFKGDRLAPATWFRVSADELDQLEYVGGEFGPQTEEIGVIAFSLGVPSEIATFNITTLPNLNAPDLTVFNASSRLGTSYTLESLFTWSDPEGDMLQSVRLYDTGSAANSGYIEVNGFRQPARTWIEIPYDEIDTVRYQMANIASEEKLRIAVSDGRNLSEVGTSTLTAIGVPVIEATVNDLSVDTIERIPVTSIINKLDLGPSYIQYQVYDENDFFRSGRLELNGTDLQQGVVHTLTAAEFNQLVFKGAESDFGRQLDPMLIRADNGITGWSEWVRVNLNTDPVGTDALTSGAQWVDFNEKTTVTYSFIDGNSTHNSPSYYVCEPADDPDDECNVAGEDVPLNQPMRETMREVFDYYSRVSNLVFVEEEHQTDGSNSAIVIGAADLPAGVGAWAYYPNGSPEAGKGAKPGDIWFDTDSFDPATVFDVGMGSAFRFTALHELGHALGLKHPFEEGPVLSIFTDFEYNTVMSYTNNSVNNPLTPFPGSPSTGMLYDVGELQNLYGANMDWNTNNNHYGNYFDGSYPHFSTNDEQFQTQLWDAGGFDTLNYSLHVADESIDLREGTWSTINGVETSLRISYGTVIENARGGSGNDNIHGNEVRNLLFGNNGNDTLIGSGGNDFMRGGSGNDDYIWSLGDGRDRIDEENKGGLDEMFIYDPSGQVNSLEDDFIFRRLGNDLRLDITLNQGGGQGTVVFANMHEAGSQVELLRIHDKFGNQIGNPIDLLSVWDTADNLRRRFEVTDQLGANGGFIASPIT